MVNKFFQNPEVTKGFAAGCSRDVIAAGAEQLGWSLDELIIDGKDHSGDEIL